VDELTEMELTDSARKVALVKVVGVEVGEAGDGWSGDEPEKSVLH
jgi:hypothetical protein